MSRISQVLVNGFLCVWLLLTNTMNPSSIFQVFNSEEECKSKIEFLKKDGVSVPVACVNINTVAALAHVLTPIEKK